MKTGPEKYYEDKAIAESFEKRVTTKAAISDARCIKYFLVKFLNISRESLCLSVGCGTGAKEELIDCDNLVCIDLAKEMLKIAARKRLTCVQGSVFKLPFADHTFDSVFTIGVSTLHYTDEMLNNTVGEMTRVAKVGGRVCTFSVNAFAKRTYNFIHYGKPNYDLYMVKNSVMRKAFRNAGLVVIHHCNIGLPKVHSIWANITLVKLKLDFLSGTFVCCGIKKGSISRVVGN